MYDKSYVEILPGELDIRLRNENPYKKTFHVHSQYEIVLSLSDCLYADFGTYQKHLPYGSLLLINSSDLHRLISKTEPCPRYILYFSPVIVLSMNLYGTDLLEYFYNRPGGVPLILPPPKRNCGDIKALFSKLEKCANSGDSVYGLKLSEILALTELLLKINLRCREYYKATERRHIQRSNLAYEAIHYIHTHYSENITTDNISAEFYTSKSNLNRLFRMMFGLSVYKYIEDYRVTKAKEFLLAGYPVEVCGQMTGYDNPSYFSRFFKKSTGIAPKQYQLSRRNDNLPYWQSESDSSKS